MKELNTPSNFLKCLKDIESFCVGRIEISCNDLSKEAYRDTLFLVRQHMKRFLGKRDLKIVEGVESVWHYHLSNTGLSGYPALCGNKNVMNTSIPFSSWGKKGHIPQTYCQKCNELKGGD